MNSFYLEIFRRGGRGTRNSSMRDNRDSPCQAWPGTTVCGHSLIPNIPALLTPPAPISGASWADPTQLLPTPVDLGMPNCPWGQSSSKKWNFVAKGESENGRKAAKSLEVCSGESQWGGEKAGCSLSQSCWKKMLENLGKKGRKKLNCLGLSSSGSLLVQRQ